jgi:hypothetical protein
MTEAQMQSLFDAIEGLRRQLSTFSDIVLLELEATRRKRVAAEIKRSMTHP